MKRKTGTKKLETSFIFYLLPSLFFIGLVTIYPLVYSFSLSFMKWDIITMPEPVFAGLSNYQNILNDELAILSLTRTAYFLSIDVPIIILCGFLLALLLNRNFKGRRICIGLLIIPWAVSPVAGALQWRWIFNAKYGIFNFILYRLGLIENYLLIFDDPLMSMLAVIVAESWRAIPFITLLCLAGLGGIDPTLYEAAMIDGAGAWKRFRHVTLPMMRKAILIATVLQTIWSIQVFDTIYVLTKGGPANQTVLVNYYVWRTAFAYLKFGYGSALAYLVLGITLGIVLPYIRIVRRRE